MVGPQKLDGFFFLHSPLWKNGKLFLLFWIYDSGRIFSLGVKLFCFAYVIIYCQSKCTFFVQGISKTAWLNFYIDSSQKTLSAQYLVCGSHIKKLILICCNGGIKLISNRSTWSTIKTTWRGAQKLHQIINFCSYNTILGQKMRSVLV